VVHGCYPEYHQEFEGLEDHMIRWNPWTDNVAVWGAQPPTPDMYTGSNLWLTRCNLLFLWMVETYSPERVMRQFGLYQQVPPPVPRRLDDIVHT
jgi:hypothetical protein